MRYDVVDISGRRSAIRPGRKGRSLGLLRPQIPLADINGGIGWADVADPTKSVKVLIIPYPHVIEGDQISLFWGDSETPAAHYTVDNLGVSLFTLDVPVSAIKSEGLSKVFYKVSSPFGGIEDRSPEEWVTVKLSIPGGPDSDPATPYENENLAPPHIPYELIDHEIAEGGFFVTIPPWVNMAHNDRLTLSWGTQRLGVTGPLVVGEPVQIFIDRETILAGGDGEDIVVRYEIRDEVNNWSLWSPKSTVDVDAAEGSLEPPLVADAAGGVIDLDILGQRDASVIVTGYDDMAVGDRVQLIWAGVAFDGNPVDDIQEREVAPGDTFFNFLVRNPVVRAIAQGHAVVRYHVYPAAGGVVRSSKRVSVQVKGELQPLLPVPIVREASGGALDPAAALEGATVDIAPWEAMSTGDEILLWWAGTTASGSPTLYRASAVVTGNNLGKTISMIVPPEEVSLLAGGSLDLYYMVQPVTGSLMESPHAALQILGETSLKPPRVDHADGDRLDPDAVPATGTTVIAPHYTGMAPGDRIDLYWDGRDADSSYSDHFVIGTSWGHRDVPFPLAKDYVTANDGDTVRVYYTVLSGGVLRSSQRLLLTIGAVAAERPAPRISEADGAALDPLAAQASLTAIIAYPDIQAGDLVSVTWTGPDGMPPEASHATAPVPVTGGDALAVALPTTLTAFALGQGVTVHYVVSRDGQTTTSDSLELMVGELPVEALPRPRIPQAVGDDLRVSTLTSDPDVSVAPWPLIATGQRVWMRLRGVKKDGTPYLDELLLDAPVAAAEVGSGMSRPASLADLKGLRDASDLDIEFKVAFDKVADEGSATPFPGRSYKIDADWTPSVIGEVRERNADGRVIPHDGSTMVSTIYIRGTGSPDTEYLIFDSGNPPLRVISDADGNWARIMAGQGAGLHRYQVQDAVAAEPKSAEYRVSIL